MILGEPIGVDPVEELSGAKARDSKDDTVRVNSGAIREVVD